MDGVATVTEGVGYLAGLGWAGLGCSCICRRCCMQTQRNSPHTHAGLGRADSRSGVALNSTHPFRHCSPAAARCARAPAHSADQHMQPAPFTRNHAFTLLGCGAALEILDFFSTSRRCLLRLFVKPFVRLPGLASGASAVPTCLLPPALPRRSPPSARSCLARHFPIVVTASRAQLELRLASCMRSSSQALAHGLHWGHRSHPWSSLHSLLPARPDPTVRQSPAPPLLHPPAHRRRPRRRRLPEASPPSSPNKTPAPTSSHSPGLLSPLLRPPPSQSCSFHPHLEERRLPLLSLTHTASSPALLPIPVP